MRPEPSPKPNVVVVMCTHNGGAWVEDQLQSLVSQTYPVAIRVFDDASTDDTVAKVLAFSKDHDIQCTERTTALGFVENFASGIQAALEEGFQYIALADQDDIWISTRIERGMTAILSAEASTMATAQAATDSKGAHLVHSDLTMVNANNAELHPSFLGWRGYQTDGTKSLSTVLGQNGVMGNTVLMNANLARLALPFPAELHVHDYWLALVAELLGERHYLPECLVRYRIHEKNVSNSSRNVSKGDNKRSQRRTLNQFLGRDRPLPFKEDTRSHAVNTLLTDERFKAITTKEREIIGAFLRYLKFSENRIKLLIIGFRYNFFRPNLRHRLRTMVSILTTRRYPIK